MQAKSIGQARICAADTLGEQFQRFIQVLYAVTWEVMELGEQRQRNGRQRLKEPEASLGKRRLNYLTTSNTAH